MSTALENYSDKKRYQVHGVCSPYIHMRRSKLSHAWSQGLLTRDIVTTSSHDARAHSQKLGGKDYHERLQHETPYNKPGRAVSPKGKINNSARVLELYDTTTTTVVSPFVSLSFGHFVPAPPPRHVVVHTTVTAEQSGARPQEHRQRYVPWLHCSSR